ncbi:ATP-binding protein [Rubrivirga sp.]|uniref:ATP-binding protein n=1 Tax=Rubrivirga sp. TaxID=1885344 RepID=UPI003C731987
MNADALPDLPTAEGTNVAFLPTPDPDAAARTVAAFLNGSGGLVMIGYDATGTFTGFSDHSPETSLQAIRQHVEHAIVPREPLQITPIEKDGLAAMLVEVPSGTRKPYLVEGAIYVRRGDANKPATPAEISRVVARRGRAEERWERQPALDLDPDEALSAPLIRETYRRAVERLDVPVTPDNRLLSFLEALGLAAEGYPTRAALALFAQPDAVPRYLPQARAQVLSFEDDTAEKPLSRRELSGGAAVLAEPLFEAAAVTLPRILRLTEGFQRDDRLAVPAPALREVLVNALAHRDYTDSASVSLRFFPDRVEVWNPGRMDQAFLADDGARLVSRPTNPDVARAFNLLGYAEGTGIGLWRVRQAMTSAGLPPPEWRNQTGGVLLTLWTTDSPERRPVPLAPRLAHFVSQTRPGEEITRAEYHHTFAAEVSDRTASNDIQELVNEGFLRQVGSGRFTSYVRTDKASDPS